jgi:hypothetical protein
MKATQDGEMSATASDDAAAMVPRRRRRVAPVTLEEKRARQRAYVKKSYYRQLVRRASDSAHSIYKLHLLDISAIYFAKGIKTWLTRTLCVYVCVCAHMTRDGR